MISPRLASPRLASSRLACEPPIPIPTHAGTLVGPIEHPEHIPLALSVLHFSWGRYQRTPAQILLRWCIQRQMCPLPKSVRPPQWDTPDCMCHGRTCRRAPVQHAACASATCGVRQLVQHAACASATCGRALLMPAAVMSIDALSP